MKNLVFPALAAAAAFTLCLSDAAVAQSNNDDHTPLNSRIKRARQFPTELPPNLIPPEKLTKTGRERSKAMLGQFSRCLYNRSKEDSLELLGKTDLGFSSFQQIGLDDSKAMRIYGFKDCLGRVADRHHSGVVLRFRAGALRSWLVQEAYFDRYQDAPGWVKPGHEIAERSFPISDQNAGVRAALDFADCVVAAAPYEADFLYRTTGGSDDEKQAIDGLMPSLGPCLPQGQQAQLSEELLRTWLGEALWHASQNSRPAATS
jgi:hypothetical protein